MCNVKSVFQIRSVMILIRALKFATLQKKNMYGKFVWAECMGGICVTSKRNRHCRRSQNHAYPRAMVVP